MKPAISVITICRNALPELRKTMASVMAQECRDFEWIIIDGASEDGTSILLEELNEDWIKRVSEPDTGIYHAMNKGLELATGNRVWFMNAGDTFYDPGSIGKGVMAGESADILFGEVIVEGANGEELGTRSTLTPHSLPEKLQREQFQRGMVVSHQAFIAKRSIIKKYQSDRYKLSADLDWMLSILNKPRTSVNLGLLARVAREGATMERWKESQFERFLILARHFGYPRTIWNHIRIAFRRLAHGRKTRYWR